MNSRYNGTCRDVCRPCVIPSCGWTKFTCDVLGDHVNTCTVHSGVKKDLTIGQSRNSLIYFTQHTGKRLRRWLRVGVSDVVTSIWIPTCRILRDRCLLGLRIVYDHWGSRSNPSLTGHLHYPSDLDRTLNENTSDKVLQYRVDYNNNPSHNTVLIIMIILPPRSSGSVNQPSLSSRGVLFTSQE